MCASRNVCALLAKRGKALARGKAAVSEAVPFYVLRPIVNTRRPPAAGTFICSYTFPSTFVRMAWSSIAVAATRAPAAVWSVRKNRRFISGLISRYLDTLPKQWQMRYSMCAMSRGQQFPTPGSEPTCVLAPAKLCA